ncbi:Plant UBX domain-containing protein 5, partial [Linum perenne]
FVFQSPQKYPTSSSPPPPLTNYSNAIAPGDSNERSNMESAGEKKTALTDADITALVDSFREITSSTRDEAAFYLESHQWDLDIAVSTFLDHDHNAAAHAARAPPDEHAPPLSPPRSRSRSMSPAPATASRLPQEGRSKEDKKKKKKSCGSGGASGSRNRGGIRTLADLNRNTAGSDSDDDDDDDDEEMQEYYTGGEKSGMLVQDPSKNYDADAIFDHAKNSLAVQKPEDIARATAAAASKSFTGTGRLLSGETVQTTPQPPAFVNHTITLWRNGFTVDDGPLRRLNDPANAEFLEVISHLSHFLTPRLLNAGASKEEISSTRLPRRRPNSRRLNLLRAATFRSSHDDCSTTIIRSDRRLLVPNHLDSAQAGRRDENGLPLQLAPHSWRCPSFHRGFQTRRGFQLPSADDGVPS